MRETGIVKSFNPMKGYGFLIGQDGKDIFVHYRDIVSDRSFKVLEKGDQVSFTVENTTKGLPQARGVEILGDCLTGIQERFIAHEYKTSS